MNLHNKRILLTGATGGVGQPTAQRLAEKGAILTLVGRHASKLNALQSVIINSGGKASTIVADLNAKDAPQIVAETAHQQLGGIDILINNAGVLDFIAFEQQSDARIAEMIQTNVTSLIQLTRAVLPHFQAQQHGHFLFVGSIFGSLGFPHYATYCASKFAVHGFSQALRRELIDSHIGVTYVAPRTVETAMNAQNTIAMLKKAGQAVDQPETVADIIIKALEQEKQEVFIGQPQSFFAWLNGVAPKLVNLGLKKQTALAKPYLSI
ncbi:MAG: SDR family oxidoreductase [Methylophilaceae bacterium]|nr:SDR family oxidoreductase [Methylophilaceae bacterium]MDG1445820.1 SDR family oxidoreductase [Methylophilaceae bacterium]MDG1820703.1 SDR family oxidoreductase [Methylophilaceae bacterium]MDG2293154.1 SDR family oxidoreductase [Methylophilaceae bacterium]